MSCEAAQSAYVEEMNVGGPKGPADITASQYGSIMNGGGYFEWVRTSLEHRGRRLRRRPERSRRRRHRSHAAAQRRRGGVHRVARPRHVLPRTPEARRHADELCGSVTRSLLRSGILVAALAATGCAVSVAGGLDESRANRVVALLSANGIAAEKAVDLAEAGRFHVDVASDEASRAVEVLVDQGHRRMTRPASSRRSGRRASFRARRRSTHASSPASQAI